MKLLPTSDWHVGKAIRGASRADEHRAVLDEIAAIAEREAGGTIGTTTSERRVEVRVGGTILAVR